MRVVLQRVREARVTIQGRVAGEIASGLTVLAAFSARDTAAELQWMAEKIVGLRIFNDDDGKMNRDLAAVQGALLVVSQFTLYGDASRGRRPSFVDAAPPAVAEPLYRQFVAMLQSLGATVVTGEFGADMQVSLINDGPVTLVIDRDSP